MEERTVPTGVAIRDAREQLFDAAERVLLQHGPSGLTSRAVTTEAGVAKGVLHRHFADFDAFLVEFVLDRMARIDAQAAALQEAVGTGTVVDNLTGILTELFGAVTLAIIRLILARDELLTRLRQARPARMPILSEATAMITSYLATERELGRVAVDADIDTLAPMLVGTGHLLLADREGTPPSTGAVHKVVTTVIGDVERQRRP
ncbi:MULTISPECIES: TetR/AcrR family transcriptional regulator [unclassified Micromonospora]|uniref:TetR/AcrR family transcriptional regulator n=1 Tax=unclassified Micromonospora TaxID=2617518 RepID=UPI00332F2938